MSNSPAEANKEDCIFCKVAVQDPHDQVFWADEDVVAFLDIAPATPGHTLVVPRQHVTDIFDIPSELFAAVARSVQRVAGVLDERLKPEGLTLIQSNRVAGWQDVFHLHVHLIPRRAGDALVQPWTPKPEDHEILRQLTNALR